jgi:hypothetical protein
MSFDLFQAPIPGQSLTQEQGGAPFEHPPQFTDPNDALEYMFDKLTEARQVVRLVLMVKKGVPVEYIARAIVFQGFSSGKWTPDVAMLMLRIVMAMIISIVVQKGVKPTIFNPDKEQKAFLDGFLDMAGDTPPVKQEEAAPKGISEEFTGLLGVEL